MKCNTPRIMLVGTSSGCGKTTVTCALLNALVRGNHRVTSFKCGPDYIDPMFHTKAIGTTSSNLDLYLCGENATKYLFYRNVDNADIAVVEGAMGAYDGLGFDSDDYSATHIAKILNIPQILVVDVKGKSFSLLAEIHGYISFSKNNIKAVILNNCSKMLYTRFKMAIEQKLDIKVLGHLEHVSEAKIKSRHLGLITANEVEDIKNRLDILGENAKSSIDINGVLALANSTEEFEFVPMKTELLADVTIAVAMDKAFCFYYDDNLKLLRDLGAKLVLFSPLNDDNLPQNIDGIFLGGGYPEEYLQALSGNKAMLSGIKTAIDSGIPTYAECGGFMYLGKTITKNDESYTFADVVDANFNLTAKLVRFGYGELTANKDNMMCEEGRSIACHEFHYSDSDNNGDSFTLTKQNKNSWECIVTTTNLFAGYPHLHFWGNIDFARNFVKKCSEYKRLRKGENHGA